MTLTIGKFTAYMRTGNIARAKSYALAYRAVVGFCPLDGMYYVIDWQDWNAAPLCGNPLPIPKEATPCKPA